MPRLARGKGIPVPTPNVNLHKDPAATTTPVAIHCYSTNSCVMDWSLSMVLSVKSS